jgi:signal transduction histidine kinase
VQDLLRSQLEDAGVNVAEVSEPVAKLLSEVAKTYASMQAEQAQSQKTIKLRSDQLISSVGQAYSFLDQLHLGLVMCDVFPQVVLTNYAAQSMLNGKSGKKKSWTLEEMSGIIHQDWNLADKVKTCLREMLPMEFKEVPCGELVLRLFIAPMSNKINEVQQPIGVIILMENITEQAVMARSKDEFFFIASHELRTPLTAIRGNSSLILEKRDKISADMMNGMLHDIHNSAVRLIDIVNDFLDVSALETGKIEMRTEDFELGDVVEEVLRDLGSVAADKGNKLSADSSLAALPLVIADRQRTKQVIYNLVGNALKFTEHGQVVVSGKSAGSLVQCFVQDTGQGMSKESHRLLFRKFQQAGDTNLLSRDSTRGTGLGLYISKLIVEQSGGTIRLESSEPGKGSVFCFTLPVAHQAG